MWPPRRHCSRLRHDPHIPHLRKERHRAGKEDAAAATNTAATTMEREGDVHVSRPITMEKKAHLREGRVPPAPQPPPYHHATIVTTTYGKTRRGRELARGMRDRERERETRTRR
jgi:hypothetical protein